MHVKPRTVVAKITRTVTEWATVALDSSGAVEDVLDVHEEAECDDIEIHSIKSARSVHP